MGTLGRLITGTLGLCLALGLREKIGKQYIRTLRSQGYLFPERPV